MGVALDFMRVLRAAVVLGVSTPLVVACGGTSKQGSTADDGGSSSAGTSGQAGSSGVGGGATGGSSGAGGGATGGSSGVGGGATGGSSGVGGGATGGSSGAGGKAMGGSSGAGGGATGGSSGAAGSPVDPPTFQAPVPVAPGQGIPSDVALVDWDDKPGLDVIFASRTELRYFSNDGLGGFPTSVSLGAGATALGMGRFDAGDSFDLLLGRDDEYDTTVAFGDGAGAVDSSEKETFGSEGYLQNFFVADVDGSGDTDDFVSTCDGTLSVVVTTGMTGPALLDARGLAGAGPRDGVLAKLGTGQWLVSSTDEGIDRSLVTYSTGPSAVEIGMPLNTPIADLPGQLDVGDFNRDGFDDVAMTFRAKGAVGVLLGDGNGTGGFLPLVTYDVGDSADDVKMGEFNGDGKPDIVVSLPASDAVAVLVGDGEGGFSEPTRVSTGAGSHPTRLAVGDLDGSERDDLAVVGAMSHQVIVLLSKN